MKKYLFSFLVFFFILTISNDAESSCPWLPNGYSTDGWIEGKTNRVEITDDCWLIYTYCYREYPEDSKNFEIVITSYRTKGSTPWYLFSSCLNELNKKKEIMFDKAINTAVLEGNLFGFSTSLNDCPNYGDNIVRVIESSCTSAYYYDWSENDGDYVKKPCNGTGYCEYIYRYCKVVDPITNVIKGSAYTKTVITNYDNCDNVQYFNPNANVYIDCYSSNCYPNRPNPLKLVTVDQLQDPNFDDTNAYLINEW